MKNLIRAIFIVWLVFSAPICLAGMTEEYNQLKSEILDPINDRFSDSSSLSRLQSLAFIDLQKHRGKFVEKPPNAQAQMIVKMIVIERVGNERVKELQKWDNVCLNYALSALNLVTRDKNAVGSFAGSLFFAWHEKIASCSAYANLVMTAFEFNKMNYEKQGKPWLFSEAALVENSGTDGDHVFVLVQGQSGTMFAVDPWIRKVLMLRNYVKLSDLDHKLSKPEYPDSIRLSGIFGHKYNGVEYYDEMFVSASTKWVVNLRASKQVRDFVHEDNQGMRSFYENFDMIASGKPSRDLRKFPSWQVGYNQLFDKPEVDPPKVETHKKEHETSKDKKPEGKEGKED